MPIRINSENRSANKELCIILLGDSGIGKTTMLKTIERGKFGVDPDPTVSIDCIFIYLFCNS
jgi:GTPase SAR1 family protein